jgi:signal transduction histidine kinase
MTGEPQRFYVISRAVNKDVLRASNEHDALDAACRIAVEHGLLRFAWVGFKDDTLTRVEPAAWWGLEDGYLQGLRIDAADTQFGRGPTGTALRDGVHSVCNDVEHEPRMAPWRAAAGKRGYRSSAAFPLRRADRVVGSLNVYAGASGHFDETETAWLVSLSEDISYALERFDDEKRRRDAAATLRQSEARLQAQLRLADRVASMGRLASSVAHEVNNALAYLALNLEVITHELRDGAERIESATRDRLLRASSEAGGGAERVRRIVHALSAFARGDEDPIGPVDVHEVLASALEVTGHHVRGRARLVQDYRATRLARANPFRLEQVFVNLLVNAAQAIPDGAHDANEIRIATRDRDDGRVIVEVSDTGSGIPREAQGRIFEPFFTTKPIGKGTGLGLWVCRSIVTAFGGEISAHDADGQGTLFRVALGSATV